MCRKPLFWRLWFIYLLNTLAIGYINATYKSFGQTFLNNDKMLSLVGSLAAIFNAFGRLFWGRMMDLSSFKVGYVTVNSPITWYHVTICITYHLVPCYYLHHLSLGTMLLFASPITWYHVTIYILFMPEQLELFPTSR